MARGYRRNSSGFMQPVGRVPSGRTVGSPGEGHFQPQISREQKDELYAYGKNLGLKDDEAKAMAYGEKGAVRKWRAAEAKVTQKIKESQGRHEKIMEGIRKTEANTFKRLNDALIASREVDAKNKDKLGNAMPPSAQTKYLEAQLASHLHNKGARAAQTASPRAAEVTPEQEKRFKEEGPYIKGMPGTSDLLNREPVAGAPVPMPGNLEGGAPFSSVPLPGGKSLEMPPQPAEMFPVDTPATTSRGDKVTLTGQTREGQTGTEYLVKSADGKEAWLPRASFEVAEVSDGPGRGLANLRRLYEKPIEDFQPF